MNVRVALLTTVGRNPGDERIADGVIRLFRSFAPPTVPTFWRISKHDPLSMFHLAGVRREWLIRRPPGLLVEAGNRLRLNKLHHADLIVHCGTPLLWNGCEDGGWVDPVLERSIHTRRRTAPIVNVGLGASYPWESQPSSLAEPTVAYARQLCTPALINTVRDAAAQSLFQGAGIEDVMVTPCPSLFSLTDAGASAPARPIVLLNCMRLGGHYDGGQGIDAAGWLREMRRFVGMLGKAGIDHVFAPIGRPERELVAECFPGSRTVQVESLEQLNAAATGISFAVVNRLHLAIPLAGVGISSFLVGNDSRMRSTEPLGLPSSYVKAVTAERLMEITSQALADRTVERERLLELRHATAVRYRDLFAEAGLVEMIENAEALS
ncbi:hypothetical protein [Nocardia beijingensis]